MNHRLFTDSGLLLALFAGISGGLQGCTSEKQRAVVSEQDATVQERYQHCESDRDCVAIEGACSGWFFVNKVYAERQRLRFLRASREVQCPPSGALDPLNGYGDVAKPVVTVCYKSRCRVARGF